MKNTQRDYTLRALENVVVNGGLVELPNETEKGKMFMAGWRRARRDGLIRPVTAEETARHLDNRRGVRAVLLGMLEASAVNEQRSMLWHDPVPSVGEVAEALETVVYEIYRANHARQLFTLSEAGAEYLAAAEKIEEVSPQSV